MSGTEPAAKAEGVLGGTARARARARHVQGIVEAGELSAMCSARAGLVGQGWVTARPHPGKGRQCPIRWHSLYNSTSQSVTASLRGRAPQGFLGFSRALPTMGVSQVLLLPWVQQRQMWRCWERWFSPGGFL